MTLLPLPCKNHQLAIKQVATSSVPHVAAPPLESSPADNRHDELLQIGNELFPLPPLSGPLDMQLGTKRTATDAELTGCVSLNPDMI
jgi:hypothetical protein